MNVRKYDDGSVVFVSSDDDEPETIVAVRKPRSNRRAGEWEAISSWYGPEYGSTPSAAAFAFAEMLEGKAARLADLATVARKLAAELEAAEQEESDSEPI